MKLAGILVMGLAMVFLAVGFIMLPITTEAAQDLLDYQYSDYTAITDATYTGYTALIGITPLLILLGYLSAAVFSFYLGVQVSRGVAGTSVNLGTLILLSLSIVFIAIGLIVQPVAVDGISGAYAAPASQADVQTGVTTAVGVTTGNITLTDTLYNNAVAQVTSVSSNITETPVADNYTSPLLYLTGLTANETRTITTTYNYAYIIAGDSQFTGYSALLLASPMLVHLGFLAGAVLSGFFGLKRLGRG